MLSYLLSLRKIRALYSLPLLVIFALCSLQLPSASAATVTIAWDQNLEGDVIGYKMHYDTTSNPINYQYTVGVQNNTSCSIFGLVEGTTYYFAATAYNDKNVESSYSEELPYTVPNTPLPPKASFSGIPRNGTAPLEVSFADSSSGVIDNWLWSFGDGATSIEPNPTYTYNNPGTYAVTLEVSGPGGSDSEIKNNYITATVQQNNTPPVVEAGADQTVTLPDAAILDGTVTDDGLPNPPREVTTTWSKVRGTGEVTFGHANAVDTTATFSKASTYVLRLTADDGELITADDTTITVNPVPEVDHVPPSPDPLTWKVEPHATGISSISMTATTATDVSGVEYYFECLTAGGHDSGWQASPSYEDTGLQPDTEYMYWVKARDKSPDTPDGNETAWSSAATATTIDTSSATVEILGSWVSGTSHAKEPGDNRALVFTAHVEDNDGVPNLEGVTYGGKAMTKIIERSVGSSYRAHVVAYILDEAGIAAASNGAIVPTWTEKPDKVAYSSIFFANVNQFKPIRISDRNYTTSLSTLTTNSLATADGDLVFVAGTCGNTGSYSINNDFTEGIELTMSSSDAVAGYKEATGTSEIPSITHSRMNRQVVVGFVIQKR